MANVVRFTLPTARNQVVPGVGAFKAGVLDIDANDLRAIKRARYLTPPYGAIEVGTVASTTPPPALPAVPAAPNPDPYPQYVTDADLDSPASGPMVKLRAALVQRWKPNTAYASGEPVVNPSGQLVTANTAFTSGASYVAGNWTVSGGGTVVDATTTAKGIVELATTAETTTGTDAVRAVTPAGVKAATDALAIVARTGAYTDLTGKPTTGGSLLVGTLAPTKTAPPTSSQALNPFMCRWGCINGPVGVSDLRLYFAQWRMVAGSGDTTIGNDGVYKVALEYNGVVYPAFWPDGTRTKTIVDGGMAGTLPIPVDIPAGATFFVRTFYTGASWPRGDMPGTVAGTSYSQTDTVDSTGNAGLGDLIGGQGINPCAITGTPWGAVTPVAIIGDSIAEGFGDTVNARGFIRAALGDNFPNINLAVPSERANQYLTTTRRRALIGGAKVAIEEYGNNDLANGSTQAALEADRITIWKGLAGRGCRVFSCTITPRTTSTDAWATTGNQTIASAPVEAVRIAHNTWLRAGAPLDPTTLTRVSVGTAGAVKCNVYDPTTGAVTVAASGVGHPLIGVFDPTGLVESAVDSGRWKAGTTTDGIHPNGTGVTTMAPAVRTERLAA